MAKHLKKRFLKEQYCDLSVDQKLKFRIRFYKNNLGNNDQFTISKDGNLRLPKVKNVAKKPNQSRQILRDLNLQDYKGATNF